MNPVKTIFIHLNRRQYKGIIRTLFRYIAVKYYKYIKKTVNLTVRDREQIKIIMHPGCAVSESLYVVGLYNLNEMTTLEKLMRPGEVFYDVGANIGPFSLLAHKKGASVYAFEGHPKTAERCRMNFQMNGINEDRAIASAVSDQCGSVLFTGDTGSSVNRIIGQAKSDEYAGAIKVPVTSIDVFAPAHESPTAVKIDTEGHELNVIKGMQSALAQGSIKYITFEANGLTSETELGQMKKIFDGANYMVGNIDWDKKIFVEKSNLGAKSDTGDYIAISRKWADIFIRQGIVIRKA